MHLSPAVTHTTAVGAAASVCRKSSNLIANIIKLYAK